MSNLTSAKPGTRLSRIQTFSGRFRIINGLLLVIGVPYGFAILMGWLPLLPKHIKIVLSAHQVYALPSEMPPAVLALALVRLGLFAFNALVLNNLFRLYERGIFFSAKNVLYLRFLGYYVLIDYVVIYQLEFLSHRGMDLSATQLFIGLMIIFISWIMDEGRKIQEEQALTV